MRAPVCQANSAPEKILLTSEKFCGLLCVGGDSDDKTNDAGTDAAGADLKSDAAQIQSQR